jgi:hypothetical protein
MLNLNDLFEQTPPLLYGAFAPRFIMCRRSCIKDAVHHNYML